MTTIHEIRELLTDAADTDRTPEEWLTVVALDACEAVALLPLIRLAEPGSRARDLVARKAHSHIRKAIAGGLEMLEALERAEGLVPPVEYEEMTGHEAQEALARLTEAAHTQEPGDDGAR